MIFSGRGIDKSFKVCYIIIDDFAKVIIVKKGGVIRYEKN